MLLRAALRWCLRLSCQGTVWQHWQHTRTCHVSTRGFCTWANMQVICRIRQNWYRERHTMHRFQ